VADGAAEGDPERPRPRPDQPPPSTRNTSPAAPRVSGRPGRNRGRGRGQVAQVAQVARVEPQQGAQVVAAAGNAIVTAARVGRLLGRSGWRIARQLPGVDVVEAQAQKLRQAATAEMLRMLEVPQSMLGSSTPEEQRAVMLVQNSGDDPEPLRSAMTELLQRSTDPDRGKSRDYLFGTIVSQLVPDEARILAALAPGGHFALVDVVAKQIGRSATRTVLADVSTVGVAAGISAPVNTATYIGRLRTFGLVDIENAGSDAGDLAPQFDALENDDAVRTARGEIDNAKLGSARVVRKTLTLSSFGREFWSACAPSRSELERRPG
jgi:hypothetical protein